MTPALWKTLVKLDQKGKTTLFVYKDQHFWLKFSRQVLLTNYEMRFKKLIPSAEVVCMDELPTGIEKIASYESEPCVRLQQTQKRKIETDSDVPAKLIKTGACAEVAEVTSPSAREFEVGINNDVIKTGPCGEVADFNSGVETAGKVGDNNDVIKTGACAEVADFNSDLNVTVEVGDNNDVIKTGACAELTDFNSGVETAGKVGDNNDVIKTGGCSLVGPSDELPLTSSQPIVYTDKEVYYHNQTKIPLERVRVIMDMFHILDSNYTKALAVLPEVLLAAGYTRRHNDYTLIRDFMKHNGEDITPIATKRVYELRKSNKIMTANGFLDLINKPRPETNDYLNVPILLVSKFMERLEVMKTEPAKELRLLMKTAFKKEVEEVREERRREIQPGLGIFHPSSVVEITGMLHNTSKLLCAGVNTLTETHKLSKEKTKMLKRKTFVDDHIDLDDIYVIHFTHCNYYRIAQGVTKRIHAVIKMLNDATDRYNNDPRNSGAKRDYIKIYGVFSGTYSRCSPSKRFGCVGVKNAEVDGWVYGRADDETIISPKDRFLGIIKATEIPCPLEIPEKNMAADFSCHRFEAMKFVEELDEMDKKKDEEIGAFNNKLNKAMYDTTMKIMNMVAPAPAQITEN